MIDKTQILQPIPGGGATVPTIGNENYTLPKIPSMAFTQKKKIKNSIGNDRKQLIVVEIDGSGSMAGQKGKNADEASQNLKTILADPANKNGFILSVIHFNGSAQLKVPPELATTAILPPLATGGGTNFDSALKLALNVIEGFIAKDNVEGWDYLRPHVLFLSDGHSSVADKNIDALHEVADVTSIAYGMGADETTLSRVASDGNVHVVGTNGDELRNFLAKVGETLSKSLASAQ